MESTLISIIGAIGTLIGIIGAYVASQRRISNNDTAHTLRLEQNDKALTEMNVSLKDLTKTVGDVYTKVAHVEALTTVVTKLQEQQQQHALQIKSLETRLDFYERQKGGQ